MAGILLFLSGIASAGQGEYHIFTDQQDRTVAAKIITVDAKRGLVELELENKRRTKVNPSVFCEKDQAYIQAWQHHQAFLSGRLFRVSFEALQFEDKKNSFEDAYRSVEVRQEGFDIHLENRSSQAIENIEVEYCIYYAQQGWKQNEQLCSEGVLYDLVRIEPLAPGEKRTLRTQLVDLYKAQMDSSFYQRMDENKSDGEVHGIRLRFHMGFSSGEKITREVCMPEGLEARRAWKASSAGIKMGILSIALN
jgi:hypothetical protein